MKKIILIIATVFAGLSLANAQDQDVKKQESAFEWINTEVNLGEIPKGIPATATYEFINKGEKAVMITNVRTSCGCTSKNYTKEPIKPGEKSQIQATYNAARAGAFHKTITVTTNEGGKPKVLRIKGTVVAKKEKEHASK